MSFLSNVTIARATTGPSTVFTEVAAASRADLVQSSYDKAVTVQTSNAPVLTADPTDARAYAGADGKSYFVPQAAVGKRQNNPQVPDVFFDVKSGKTLLSVSFDLAKPAAAAADATLLLVDNFGVTLIPSAGGKAVPFTDLQVTPVSDASKGVALRLLAQTAVDENIVPGVLRSDTNAWFEVKADLQYRVQQPAPTPPQPQPDSSATSATTSGSATASLIRSIGVASFASDVSAVSVSAVQPTAAAQPAAVMSSETLSTRAFDPGMIATVNQTPATTGPVLSDVKKARVLLSNDNHDGLSAYFPVENTHNRPIFAKIMSLEGANDSTWAATSDGYLRSSAQPNQLYVLPDSFGLAIDPQSGMPAMSVLLVQVPGANSGPPTYRVRTRFVVVPSLAPDRLMRIRQTLRQAQEIAYADLVIGGYDKATFTPSHLFDKLSNLGPAFLGAAEGAPIDVDAANGFELVLDCSMEFYTLLTTLVTTEEGLKGSVNISIHTDANTAFTSEVPVRITLGAPASVPLHISVEDPGGAGSTHACALNVTNTAIVDVSADSILPTLLLKDGHMPYPSNAFDVSAVPQSIALKPAGKVRVLLVQAAQTGGSDVGIKIGGISVNIDPKTGKINTPTPELPPWSAVAVGFSGVRVKFDPNQVLSKVHQLASSTRMNSAATVASYLLKHPDQIPKSLTGLVGIHVQLKAGTADPVDVYLTTDNPGQTVQIGFSFADLLAGLKPDEPTFQWRRANMFAAKEGDWSPWATNTGSNLYVTPVGV